MNITLLGGSDGGDRRGGGFRDRSPRGRRGGDRNGGGRRDGNRGGNRNRDGGNRGGGGGRQKKEEITQEQLDAEMDDYLNKREVS